MKKILLTLSLTATIAAHAQTPIHSEDDAIKAIIASISEHKLTSLPPECLSFYLMEESADSYEIEIREKHDDICGGDPQTAPRLFSYMVNKNTGELATTAMRAGIEWDGEYYPIPSKTQK